MSVAVKTKSENAVEALDESFADLMNRLRDGDATAILDITQKYEPHLRRVIRRKMDRRIQSKFDSQDFLQMVWTSFFQHPSMVIEFDQPKQLVGYLTQIAKHKLVDEHRHQIDTQKNNVDLEQSMNDSKFIETPPSHAETPSQVMIARERWTKLMENQTDRDKEIIRLRICGNTFDEIASKLTIDECTARRVVKRLVKLTFEM